MASDTGYLYILDGTGEVKQQYNLGAEILAMAVTGFGDNSKNERRIVTGQRDGRVLVLGAEGDPVARFQADSPIKLLQCIDLNGDGHDEIVAVSERNQCVVLQE